MSKKFPWRIRFYFDCVQRIVTIDLHLFQVEQELFELFESVCALLVQMNNDFLVVLFGALLSAQALRFEAFEYFVKQIVRLCF